jgi:hypothetical protein
VSWFADQYVNETAGTSAISLAFGDFGDVAIQPVKVVPGLAANVKITTPEDLHHARRTKLNESGKKTQPRAPRAAHPRPKPSSQPPLQ